MNEEQKVSVILVNYNQLEYTIKCVQSILNSNYSNFEIVIIDNCSRDEIYSSLVDSFKEYDKVNLVRSDTNLGYVGGVNLGLALSSKASPEYFLIMNNDTLIAQESMGTFVETCKRHGNKIIVSGKVYNYGTEDSLQYIGQREDPEGGINQVSIVKNRDEKDIGQYDSEMEMGMLDDIYWMFPKALYEEIGGYSEYFFLYGEQNEFALRAKKAGYKLIYTPNAKLWHEGGASTCDGNKKSPRIEYWTTMATLKLAVLHLPEGKKEQFVSKWIIRMMLKKIYLFLFRKGNFNSIKAVYVAWRHFKVWREIKFKDNGYNPF
ncbi:glycosyltransferase family 2 protein [Pleionea litopenaei]|uniref:Glycosyltransferase family 2 protein n=1 Tax=Pleionea litopenaei TaxID=3070815 RepID=A0AA51X6W3_9GAMM|nr:glycosyltransferase family 2 protein [Pleionea sp. HL-JVS1]WMS87279.1 glycosyltransferase family 2 protein [Pleionea sp. HL-JVS1]